MLFSLIAAATFSLAAGWQVAMTVAGAEDGQGSKQMANRVGRPLGNGSRNPDFQQSADPVTARLRNTARGFRSREIFEAEPLLLMCPFQAHPYTIEFKGTVDGDGDEVAGTSRMKGDGPVFLGHAGEVDELQRSGTATEGLKRANNSPEKSPDDDDDDDRPRTCSTCL
jgi:hypothetical protein